MSSDFRRRGDLELQNTPFGNAQNSKINLAVGENIYGPFGGIAIMIGVTVR